MSDSVNITEEVVTVNVETGAVEVVSVGIQGPTGEGIPTGGTTGQVLTKASNNDLDAEWAAAPGAAVTSVHGRTGAVTAQSGDYTATQITNNPAGNIAATTVQAALNELDSEKAATVHTHAISDTTGLQTALDGKASTSHTHDDRYYTETETDTLLSGKADTSHTHAQGDVTNLTSDLAAKEPTISAGTTAQYWRGDKSWQTLDKSAVGLSNVDNTSDANKPVSTATQTALDGKVAKAGDTMTDTLSITRNDGSDTTHISLKGEHAGGRSDIKWSSDLDNPLAKLSAHTADDATSDETHWQVYTYKADLVTAMSVLAIQSHTNTPIATFNNLSKLQVSSSGTGVASRLYLTRQASDGSPDETNSVLIEKRATGGAQLQDIASTGNALFDIDPIASDGTSSASLRLFRNTNTTGTRSLAIYKGDNTSTLQHFFNAAGNSYVNNNAGNFTVGATSGSERFNVTGNIAVTGTVDGRDIATDGTKLDGIEASADVTDTANVSAAGAPIISSGAGVPASTPAKVGDIYVDTTGDDAYIAVGTASSADWEKSNDGAGGGISDGDKGDITVSGSGATWTIDAGSVTYAKLQDVSATNRILGRITTGAGDAEELTAANVRTIINVEDGADVTDATNVDAAGAVMNADTTTASMSFVVDEDDMTSNSATKVPTQQSVKAYVDANAGGGSGGGGIQTTTLATSNADNTATVQYGHVLWVSGAVTIDRLSCWVKVHEASQTVELGVWDSAKSNLVSATGVPSAAGLFTVSITETTIGPGLVYFGLVNRSGGATMTFAWEAGENDAAINFIKGGQTTLEATVSGESGTGRTYWIGAYKS